MYRLLFSIAVLLSAGCTAITDFTDVEEKIDIEVQTSDTVNVDLTNPVATMPFVFDTALPIEDAEDIFDLIGNEILLQVTNNESLISVSLTDTPVDAPTEPGEYSVSISDDKKTVTISFYNETVAGQTLKTDGDYTVLLQVLDNEYFETDQKSFDITFEEE